MLTNGDVRRNWYSPDRHLELVSEPVTEICPHCKGTGRITKKTE